MGLRWLRREGSGSAPGKGRARQGDGDGHDRGPPAPLAGIGRSGRSHSRGAGSEPGPCPRLRWRCLVQGEAAESGREARRWRELGNTQGPGLAGVEAALWQPQASLHQRIPNPSGNAGGGDRSGAVACASPRCLPPPPLRVQRDRIQHHVRGAPWTRRGSGNRIHNAGREGAAPALPWPQHRGREHWARLCGATRAPTAVPAAGWLCDKAIQGSSGSRSPGEGRAAQGCVVAMQGSACQQDSCMMGATVASSDAGAPLPVGQPQGGYGQDAVLTPGLGFWRTLELSRCTAVILVLALSSWAGSPSLKSRLQAWC